MQIDAIKGEHAGNIRAADSHLLAAAYAWCMPDGIPAACTDAVGKAALKKDGTLQKCMDGKGAHATGPQPSAPSLSPSGRPCFFSSTGSAAARLTALRGGRAFTGWESALGKAVAAQSVLPSATGAVDMWMGVRPCRPPHTCFMEHDTHARARARARTRRTILWNGLTISHAWTRIQAKRFDRDGILKCALPLFSFHRNRPTTHTKTDRRRADDANFALQGSHWCAREHAGAGAVACRRGRG